jgi:Spy/CpxP family protein refolding chaperone
MSDCRVFSAIGILLMTTSIVAFAGQSETTGTPEGQGKGPHGFRALNLSQAQKNQIHALWQGEKTNLAPKVKQLAQLRHDLRNEVFSDAPDESKIQDLKDQTLGLESELLASHVDLEKRMAVILTAEQRKTLRSFVGRDRGNRRHQGPLADQP